MAKSIRYVRDYEIDVIEYEILSTNTLIYAHEDRDDDASPIMKGAHESRLVNKARFLSNRRISNERFHGSLDSIRDEFKRELVPRFFSSLSLSFSLPCFPPRRENARRKGRAGLSR